MCGFVGFVLSEETSRPDLEAWSDSIQHRGPDQSGTATHCSFGIGTRRLSILDLSSAGNQPMQTDRYILGFNGEIYNHRELRAELEASGGSGFQGHSDTETVLRAIQHWGIPTTLRRLNGMFALAIWDTVREELTLARDPLGIKPLYYLPSRHGIYFASEIKALIPFTSQQISCEALALYLYFGFVPAPYSLMKGVHKVRPGEAVVFKGTAREHVRIVPEVWNGAAPRLNSREDLVQQVRAAVEAAVHRQLLSDVPVGLFLSGGVDSSVIAAAAASQTSELVSFSIRPGNASADPRAEQDAEIAVRYARTLGLSHHEVLFQPEDLKSDLDELLGWIDEPVSELYFTAEVFLSRKARELGVPVVLTGHGGDEVFLGYPTYQAALKGDKYNAMPLFGPTASMMAQLPWLSPEMRMNFEGAARVWRKSPVERYAIVSAVHFSLEEIAALSGLPLDHVRALVHTILSELHETIMQLPNSHTLNSAELFARMDMLLKVPEHYNMRLDRATMSASIEARVPLQDLELIGLVLQLPYTALLQGGLKGLLKKAFEDMVPAEVRHRPKQTFQAPMLSWIQGPLAPWVTTQLARLPDPLRGAVLASDLPPRSTAQAYRTWSLALLEAWRSGLHLEY